MPARNPARGCRTHLVRPVDVAIRAAHQLRPVKRYMPVRLRVRQPTGDFQVTQTAQLLPGQGGRSSEDKSGQEKRDTVGRHS